MEVIQFDFNYIENTMVELLVFIIVKFYKRKA